MTKTEFLEKISKIVVAENKKRGYILFSSVVIAQAICESAWGQSQIMMKANAVFGIKATSSWNGKVYNSKTQECYDGKNYTNINACFRAYDSLEESVKDYFDLITKSSRYKDACYSSSPASCITAIKNGGYATSSTYIDTIKSIITSNNLTKYDKKIINLEQIANDVINGKYGDGEQRKQNLGSLYDDVQKIVNQKLNNKKETIIHVVQKGDTLCKIAKKYGTTVSKIAENNGIQNVDLIYVGQRLEIR